MMDAQAEQDDLADVQAITDRDADGRIKEVSLTPMESNHA